LDAAWVAMCSSGEEQEKALKLAREAIEKIEEEINGKKFFGGTILGTLTLHLDGFLIGFLFLRKLGLCR